jgi:hypothetical protein
VFVWQDYEELPVTLQVAMIASDGWVIASDERSTLQGPGWIRQQHDTDKIAYRSGVASFVWGDECALIAQQRILDELRPIAESIGKPEFRQAARGIAQEVWQSLARSTSFKLAPEGIRGITFAAVGNKQEMWDLTFGEHSRMIPIDTKRVFGDPANPVIFFSEQYYEKKAKAAELAILASHIVLQGVRYNRMVGGLKVMTWSEPDTAPRVLDSTELTKRSQALEVALADAVRNALITK